MTHIASSSVRMKYTWTCRHGVMFLQSSNSYLNSCLVYESLWFWGLCQEFNKSKFLRSCVLCACWDLFITRYFKGSRWEQLIKWKFILVYDLIQLHLVILITLLASKLKAQINPSPFLFATVCFQSNSWAVYMAMYQCPANSSTSAEVLASFLYCFIQ